MTLPNQSSIIYRITHDTELAYVEDPANQAAATNKVVLPLLANASNVAFNLATYFPAFTSANAIAMTILDETQAGNSSGFWLRVTAAGTPLTGFFIRPNSLISLGIGQIPTIYLDNPNATNALNLTCVLSGS